MKLAEGALMVQSSSSQVSCRWVCATRTQVFHAAFEAHELAVRQGFDVSEATTLSLTLAELTSVTDHESEACIAMSSRGWRLEVRAPGGMLPSTVVAQAHSAFHSERRTDGVLVFVADYQRPMGADRRSSLRAAMLNGDC